MTSGSRLIPTEISKLPADNPAQPPSAAPGQFMGTLVALWGITGVMVLLSFAVARLSFISLNALNFTLDWTHWAVLFCSVVIMAYTEGYKTFQRVWAPRVVDRAFELKANWTVTTALLAPLYCMSFFAATRKRMLVAWITTACIIGLVILMNRIPQPWRGLIDAGVVVALLWGVLSLVFHAIARWRRGSLSSDI